MSPEALGALRLAVAVVGLALNLGIGLSLHRLRRGNWRLSLTHFERGTFDLSLRTGAVRGAQHLGGLALALNLIGHVGAVSWPSFVVMGIQLGALINDVQVAAQLRRELRRLSG